MSQDIATLQFKAETSDLKNANNELDKLAANAKKVEQATDSMAASTKDAAKAAEWLAESSKKGDTYAAARNREAAAAKNAAQSTSIQAAEVAKLLDTINPTKNALDKLAETEKKLTQARKAGLVDSSTYEDYINILNRQSDALAKSYENMTGYTAATKQAAKEAAELQKAQEKAAIEAEKAAASQAKTAAQNAAAQEKSREAFDKNLQNINRALDPTNAALEELAKKQREVNFLWQSGVIDTAKYKTYNNSLEEMRRELTGVAKATRDQEAADKAATDAKEKFLRQLKEQVATQNKSKAELLEYRASQLGVSSAADVYIKKIKDSESAVHSFSLQSTAARKELAVMLGELARGNLGALRGSSITLANRSGFLDQLTTLRGAAIAGGIGLIATALYTVTKAAYEGSKELSGYGKALALTGDYAGRSRESLAALAKQLTIGTTTTGQAAEAITTAAKSGKFSADQFRDAARGIIAFQTATDATAQTATAAFEKIVSDPAKGLLSLNETYHFLTASTYLQVEALVKQGKIQDAVTLGIHTFADAMDQRAVDVRENMGTIELGWRKIKEAASFAWDAMLGIGREKSLDDQLKEAMARAKATAAGVTGPYGGGVGVRLGMSIAGGDATGGAGSEVALLKSQILLGDLKAAQTKAETATREKNLELAKKIQSIEDVTLSKEEKRKRALDVINDALKAGVINQEKADKLTKNAEYRFRDPKTPKTPTTPALKLDQGDKLTDQYAAQNLALDAQIQLLKNRSAYETNASTQRKDYLELQAKYTVLEQKATEKKLTTQEQQILAVKDEALAQAKILADKGDTLAAMQKQAQVSDELSKLQETQTLSAEVYAKHNGESTKQLERQLALAQTRAAVLAKGGTQQQATQATAIKQFDYDAEDARSKDWIGGMKTGLKDWAEAASDYAKIAGDAVKSGMSMASDAVANFVLTGKLDFAEFTKSILKMIVQIISQLMVMNALKAGANAVGFGGLFANANGGVYNDPSLSKFSNGVYDSPQTFQFGGRSQFAKGGVFAEAGPEAIMPLTRDSNGRLGVKAEGGGGGAGVSINQSVTVNTNGQATTNTTSGSALGQALGNQMSAAAIEVVKRALQPGGLIYNANNGR